MEASATGESVDHREHSEMAAQMPFRVVAEVVSALTHLCIGCCKTCRSGFRQRGDVQAELVCHEVKSGIVYSWRTARTGGQESVRARRRSHSGRVRHGPGRRWGCSWWAGANWIRRGTEEFGNAIFQMKRFHLSRACGQVTVPTKCDPLRIGIVR